MASTSRQQLDTLKEQFIAGKISESTYLELKAELEAKIKAESSPDTEDWSGASTSASHQSIRPAAPFGDHSMDYSSQPPPGIKTPPSGSGTPFGIHSAEMPIVPGMELGMELPDKGIKRYLIGDLLGKGGWGAVFRAEDRKYSPVRPVALKAIFTTATADEVARKRIEREARLGVELAHPNVVRIWEFDEDMQIYFLIMELVDGGDLNSLRAKQPNERFTLEAALPLLRNIADGLDYLHSKGIIHRDLKPSNLLWRPDENRLKISDFGLSKTARDSILLSGAKVPTISGTDPYMAPEIWDVGEPSKEGDLYAMGIIAYEMLKGDPPFRGPNYPDQHRNSKVPPIPGIPTHAQTAIQTALEKEPSKRFENATEFVDALEAKKSTAKTKRSIAPFLIAAVVAVALVVAGMQLWPRLMSTPSTPEEMTEEITPQQTEEIAEQQTTPAEAQPTQYREQEPTSLPAQASTLQSRIDSLLIAANGHLQANRLTSPAGGNAYDAYREVLRLDGDNTSAQRGLSEIADRYEGLGDRERGQSDYDDAIAYYQQALEIGGANSSISSKISSCRSSQQAAEVARYEQLGDQARNNRDWSSAIQHYERAIEVGGANTSISSKISACQTSQREAEAAAAEAERRRREQEELARAGTISNGPLSNMRFVYIPAGSFTMGSPNNEEGRYDNEGPQHRVTLDAFEMMTTEVTQAMWQEVMGSNPSRFTGNTNHPVEQVSWNDIQEFITRLNQRDPGKGYRLPTEAEWEYACRAGTTTRFYSGNSDSDLSGAGWYSGNSNSTTHPVGQKSANAWGLYDMHGNVWEWCSEWYGENYYSSSPQSNPQGPSSGQYRVLRGGSWYGNTRGCRAAARLGNRPFNRNNSNGFRVVGSAQ